MTQLFPMQAMLCRNNQTLNEVIAPPYDVVTRGEVKVYTQHNPQHFLNVTRPEALLDDSIAFDDARVYQAAQDHWARLCQEGIFKQDDAPHFYVYAMDDGKRKQYGLVALISVLDYKNGVVRRHELTRPDKENDRVRHIQAVNGQLSPVLLAVKDTGLIDGLLKKCAQGTPILSASLNGVRHELWTISSPDEQDKIQQLFAQQDLLYVADGHHRTAAALRAYETSGENPYCLSVIFPSQHMKILGYHRTVKDLHGLSEADFLQALREHYSFEPISDLTAPPQHGICHMLLGKQAYALTRKDVESDPVRALDVDALSRFVLTPILGIQDIRTDSRIGFVGGLDAVDVIKRQVAHGEAAVGFMMFPTQTDELLRVADANLLMPPKSTWFEPKLADGVICYVF